MIYEYQCNQCAVIFDVVKAVADFERAESCACGGDAKRLFRPKIHLSGTAVEHPEYNPAFGQVVKNKRERQELAKQRGMIEIGNDKPKVEKPDLSKRYDEAIKGWVGDCN